MAKLWLSILFLLVPGALCQSPTPSSSLAPSPIPTASPSALPGDTPNSLYEFTNETTGLVCIKMNAGLGLFVLYKDQSDEDANGTFNINPAANITNRTYCGESTGTDNVYGARLALEWQYPQGGPQYQLDFYLKANKNSGKEQWNVTSVNATVSMKNNPNLHSQPKNPLGIVSAGYGDLVSSLDFTRSYFCNASRSLNMTVFDEATSYYAVYLNITNFQIQAFQFANTTSNDYGNAVRCSQDIKGSKLIPIIVGAALAGLVIIVLIAYIIGRYRSRKHNSYEALS